MKERTYYHYYFIIHYYYYNLLFKTFDSGAAQSHRAIDRHLNVYESEARTHGLAMISRIEKERFEDASFSISIDSRNASSSMTGRARAFVDSADPSECTSAAAPDGARTMAHSPIARAFPPIAIAESDLRTPLFLVQKSFQWFLEKVTRHWTFCSEFISLNRDSAWRRDKSLWLHLGSELCTTKLSDFLGGLMLRRLKKHVVGRDGAS